MGLIQPVPSFSQGYATHQACVAPWAWKGIVAAYAPFLGVQGNKLYDFSGFGNHGTIVNPTWVSAAGNRGFALEFDGSNIVSLGSGLAPKLTGKLTYLIWIYPQALVSAANKRLIRWSGGQQRVRIGFSNVIVFQLAGLTFTGSGNNRLTSSTNQVSINQPYLIACSWDGTTGRIYKNGELIKSDTATGTLTTPTGELQINSTSVGQNFEGQVSECRIYNRDVPAVEIAFLYSNPWAMFQRARRPIAGPFIPPTIDLFRLQIEAAAPNRQIKAKAPSRQVEGEFPNRQIEWTQ